MLRFPLRFKLFIQTLLYNSAYRLSQNMAKTLPLVKATDFPKGPQIFFRHGTKFSVSQDAEILYSQKNEVEVV